MLELLWLIPVAPFAGFLALALAGVWNGPRASSCRRFAALVGCGSIGVSAIATALVGARFIAAPPPDAAFTQTLWIWLRVGDFAPAIAFHLDALSLTMISVITFVGFLIHLYSAEFMEDDDGYGRFFAYMNLFVGAMLVLVLADNLLLLYLGWEGVGLCSYLLIGFWHRDAANGAAARKAFIVTRFGDTAMAIGLFLLYTQLGTLHIQELSRRAVEQWPAGSGLAIAAALLLLGGAVGKSAQLPLQTWLPDAMAGPTPVSALIHAATMVTAGMYLIARMNAIFALAPLAQHTVAIVGAATLLLAAFAALTQRDIKRVLAYSTISQIGYMFLALGVGAWSAAVFHFMTHAFFKALLFLGAGVVILAMGHEHDMFKMGGLRARMPLTFWTFLCGAASLAAVPFVTAGYFSKDAILLEAWVSGGPVGRGVCAAGLLGAGLTSLYTFRMVFVTFLGQAQREVAQRPRARMAIPLCVLAVLSLVGGYVESLHTRAGAPLFTSFIATALPSASAAESHAAHGGAATQLALIAAAISLGGIALAYYLYLVNPALSARWAQSPAGGALRRFWFAGWGFDWLYDRLVVGPYVWLARANRSDAADLLYRYVASQTRLAHHLLGLTQTGKTRWYAMGVAAGAVIVLAIVVFL